MERLRLKDKIIDKFLEIPPNKLEVGIRGVKSGIFTGLMASSIIINNPTECSSFLIGLTAVSVISDIRKIRRLPKEE